MEIIKYIVADVNVPDNEGRSKVFEAVSSRKYLGTFLPENLVKRFILLDEEEQVISKFSPNFIDFA